MGGGSINNVFLLHTDNGDFCVKFNNSGKYPGMFDAEARGLSLLASAQVIMVPEVIGGGSAGIYSYLLLEYIKPASPIAGFMSDFGRSIALLHRNGAEKYGLDHDNYMGSLLQYNTFHDDWAGFFSAERLQKQVKLAITKGSLSENHVKMFDSLYGRLARLLPAEIPSLLHGDLWSGNFITSGTGKACIIDPAIYYGHREIDIAMTTLFGGFSGDFYSGYNETWPLESGWKERLDLYNLYPLLIHLNLFGSGYLGPIINTLKRFA